MESLVSCSYTVCKYIKIFTTKKDIIIRSKKFEVKKF
jgi:hypothetical protein